MFIVIIVNILLTFSLRDHIARHLQAELLMTQSGADIKNESMKKLTAHIIQQNAPKVNVNCIKENGGSFG